MLRVAHRFYGIRLVLLTGIVIVGAAIQPLVAFAGNGDPTGF